MSNSSLERLKKKGQKIPWIYKILFLSLNFGALYAFFNVQSFLYIFLFGLTVLTLFSLKSILGEKRNNRSPNISIWLMLKYVKMTRKYILASSIGLILAILVFSQAFILPDSISQQIINDKLSEIDKPSLVIETSYDNNFNDIQFEEKINQSIESYGFTSSYRSTFLIADPSVIVFTKPDNTTFPVNDVYAIELTQSLFNSISKYLDPTLKYGDRINITVSFESEYSNISSSLIVPNDDSGTFLQVPIQNSLYLTPEEYSLVFEEYIDVYYYTPIMFVLINSEDFNNIVDMNPNPFFTIEKYFVYYFAPPTPDQDVQLYVRKIDEMLADLQWNNRGRFSSPIISELYNVSYELSIIKPFSTFISLPVMALALFLIYFSVNLVRKRKEKLMTIAKIRGISENQIGSILFFEMIVSSLIAIVVGLVLSIPFISLINQVFQIFNGELLVSKIYVAPSWYWKVPLLGMIFAFDLNIANIFSLMKLSIDEGIVSEEVKKSFFQKYNIDLIIFIIGILQYMVIETVKLVSIPTVLVFLVFITVPFGVLGFLLGTTLIVERYFPSFAGWVSDILWIRRGDMFALATRNLRKSKFSASKLASILVFSIVVTSLFLTLPSSIEQTAYQTRVYHDGSEAYYTPYSSFTYSEMQVIASRLKSVQGITKVSIIGEYNVGWPSKKIVGLDLDTIESVLIWKSSYADQSLSDLLSILEDENKFLTSEDMKNRENYELGKKVSIFSEATQLQLEVGGFFRLFPIVKRTSDNSPEYNIPVVVNIDKINQISQLGQVVNYRVLIKLDDTTSRAEIKNDVEEILSDGELYGIAFDQIRDSTQFKVINILSTGFIFISLLTSFVAVGFYSFISLSDRSKEIGVYRALGMVSKQIFRLLITESLFILSFSLLFGLGMNIVILRYFLGLSNLSTGSYYLQIIVYSFPIGYYVFIGLLIVATGISALIPTVKLSRQETGSILRGD